MVYTKCYINNCNMMTDNLNSFLKTSLDGSVGLIFETLRNAGVGSNTFVFFTADNGYVCM